MQRAFSPSGATVNTAVSATSSSPVKICDQIGPYQIRLKNSGTTDTFIAWGGSNVVATTATGYPVGAGVTEIITVVAPYNGPLFFAAIASGSNGNFYVTPGEGI